jgi:succinate dehydrogenase / fumarate reductase cytochrome b subunit
MAQQRPLSPHLSIWKWRVHMATSIFHRITGHALALAGVLMLCWWLAAAATSPDAYGQFLGFARSWFGLLVLVGLTWAFFQHFCSGLRHLVMDSGWGYDLPTSRLTATLTFAASILLTLLFWGYIFFVKGA